MYDRISFKCLKSSWTQLLRSKKQLSATDKSMELFLRNKLDKVITRMNFLNQFKFIFYDINIF